MKLKKPIEVSNEKRNSILSLENKILFKNTFLIITNLVFEEKEVEVRKGSFFNRRIEKETEIFLTEIELWGYNRKGKFWGTFDKENNIAYFLLVNNLYELRNEYVENIKEPIIKLGFKIVKDVNPDDNKKEILKEFSKKISEQKDCPAEFLEIVNKEYWKLLY